MASLIKLKTFSDKRGSLTVIEKVLPFEIKRIYYIYGVPSESLDRGGHKHKITRQALICVSGSCVITNNDGNGRKDYPLDSPDKCLILDPQDFHSMHHFSKDAVLLVLASEYFDAEDYLDEDYP